MEAQFETIALLQSEAEAFLGGFDRPGHTALLCGTWFHSEFEEFVEDFRDPHALIQEARNFDFRDWIARQSERNASFENGLGGLFQAMMGPLDSAPSAQASDAEKYVRTARQAFAEEEQPGFIKDLEETLDDATRMMNEQDGDPLPELLNIFDRLQNVQHQTDGLDDNLRVIQTIGQFFMGEQVAKATGADGVMDSMFAAADSEVVEATAHDTSIFRFSDPGAETNIAILPVDDSWAALAWMQHGSYMDQAVPLLAVARDMEKRFGAVPVMATCDSIGFKVAKPAKESADGIIEAFQALGATTLNGVETPVAMHQLQDKRELLAWWG